MSPDYCQITQSQYDKQRTGSNELYEGLITGRPRTKLIDMSDSLCSQGVCELFDKSNHFIYRDDNHLSPEAGRLFAQTLENSLGTR